MNLHTIALQQYIYYAPEHIQAKFANGYELLSAEWRGNIGDCWYDGLLFRDNEVYAQNIYTFRPQNKYKPDYLNVTQIFNQLLKFYNIFHACLVLKSLIKKYYRESNLTENLIIYIKNNIKEQMKANNTDANKVCKALGVDRKFIYRMTNEVKASKIVRIAHAIGCTPSDLFKGI